ncbi:MAG: hypothetical protein L0Z07_07690, partial [Planctomycetes bacterium]|nr:hypothetical protein [Planctomycetota bacterium]
AAGFLAAAWLKGDRTPSAETPPSVATKAVGPSEKQDQRVDEQRGIEGQVDEQQQVVQPIAESSTNDTQTPAAVQQLPQLPPDEAAPATAEISTPSATVAAAAAPTASIEPRFSPPKPAADGEHKPVLKFDPLDFDPLALGLSTSPASGDKVQANSVVDQPTNDAAVSAKGVAENAGSPEGDRSLQPIALAPPITVQRGPATERTRSPVAVKGRLALAIDSVEMRATSLSRGLDNLSRMADVPITLDPAALAMAGVAPGEEITIRAKSVTLEQLLRDTLVDQRLDFVERDGRIVVVRPHSDSRRSVNYEVKDLMGAEDADAAKLARLLERFVAPDTWHDVGTIEVDGTKLRIEQTHAVHYQVLIFFERLRLARDLSPRSNYPAELLTIESPDATHAKTLAKSTTFTFLPWTPLDDVVRHWSEATGLIFLVDWAALAEVDLAPSSPISCSAVDQTWEEALPAILRPLGLDWRPVDGQTIQITSQAAADRIRRIEFYTIAPTLRDQFPSAGALVEAMRAEVEEQSPHADDSSLLPAQLELDAPSGRLIVLAGAKAHRSLTRRLQGTPADGMAESESPATPQHILAQPLP